MSAGTPDSFEEERQFFDVKFFLEHIFIGNYSHIQHLAIEKKRCIIACKTERSFRPSILYQDIWNQTPVRQLMKERFLLWRMSPTDATQMPFIGEHKMDEESCISFIDPLISREILRSAELTMEGVMRDMQSIIDDKSLVFMNPMFAKPTSLPTPLTLNAIRNESSRALFGIPRLCVPTGPNRNTLFINTPLATPNGSNGYNYYLMTGGEVTKIRLRFKNKCGDPETVNLRRRSCTTLNAIYLYITMRIPTFNYTRYKLVCPYNKVKLEFASGKETLKNLGLHPSCNIFIMKTLAQA